MDNDIIILAIVSSGTSAIITSLILSCFRKKPIDIISNEERVIKRILNYSYNPIRWEYNNLTVEERRIISLEEFEQLKFKYKK